MYRYYDIRTCVILGQLGTARNQGSPAQNLIATGIAFLACAGGDAK